MHNSGLDDTIAAIATSAGESGIGIVRLSGEAALKIASKVFRAKDGKGPSSFKAYTVHYGWIVNKLVSWPVNRKTEIIDEVLLTVMRAPRSYTREDVVEINCHGGIVALRRVLELVLSNGARLADPGEFTKRAFLNGRIDLSQAEAVLDIIRAKTDAALKIGVEQLRGGLSGKVNKWRAGLLDVLSILEANIDFPEEETNTAQIKGVCSRVSGINNEMKSMLDSAKFGRLMREGMHVVICGRPNVGKSSLLNALLKTERSIVTAVPGTTRDTVEEIIDIQGIPVRIVDTAGILEPRDLIERHAVKRAKRQIDLADLVILLFDGSQRLTKGDKALIAGLKKKTVLVAINKIDIAQKIERGCIVRNFKRVVEISAKRQKNIDLLEQAIAGLASSGRIIPAGPLFVFSLRHAQAIREAQKLIAEALNSVDNDLSLELVAQDLKAALGYLDELLGKRFAEDLLDKIFSDFCIGK